MGNNKYSILETIGDGFAVVDEKFHLMYMNRRAEDMFKTTSAECLGKHLHFIFSDGEDKIVSNFFKKDINNTVIDFDYYSKKYERYYYVNAYKVEEGFALLMKDVTDVRLISYELRKKELDLSAVVSSLDDIILEVDENYLCQNIWSSHSNFLEIHNGDCIGKSFFDLIANDHKELVKRVFDKVFETQRSETVECKTVTNPIKNISLKVSYIKLKSSPRVSVVVRDISESKKFQFKAKKFKQLLSLVTRARKVGFVDCGMPNRVSTWDQNYAEILGLGDLREAPTDLLYSHMHPDDQIRLRAEVQECLTGSTNFSTKFRILKKGEWIHISCVCVVERDVDDNPIRMVCAVWDITEEVIRQRELEQSRAASVQASKLTALGQMSAGIAHEINNPMAIIQARAEYLYDSIVSGKKNPTALLEGLKSILATSHRITKIIRGLRTITRDSSFDPFELVRLNQFMEEVLVLCKSQCHYHNIELTWTDLSKGAVFECRGSQIFQVIFNLVNNSIDAIQGLKEKWIRITTNETENEIVILIEDSGSGIPASIQEKMWEPFFTTKKPLQGTGLGLWIVKGILENHKGTISLNSASSNTQFVIKLPKKQSKPLLTNSVNPQ